MNPVDRGYTEMKCSIFVCRNVTCKKRWAYCSTCKGRLNQFNVGDHARTLKHRNNLSKLEVAEAIVFREIRSEAMIIHVAQQEEVHATTTGSLGTYDFPDDGGSLAEFSRGAFMVGMAKGNPCRI